MRLNTEEKRREETRNNDNNNSINIVMYDGVI